MVATWVCDSCRGFDGMGLLGVEVEPQHCYGSADRPALAGVLGGFRCSCSCRNRPGEPERA